MDWDGFVDRLLETYGLDPDAIPVRNLHQGSAPLRKRLANALQSTFVRGMQDELFSRHLHLGSPEVTELDRACARGTLEPPSSHPLLEPEEPEDPVEALAMTIAITRHHEQIRLLQIRPEAVGPLLPLVTALLTDLEWRFPGKAGRRCPICVGKEEEGHSPLCGLDQIRARIRVVLGEKPAA
jgi:hypothetical protein